MAPYSPPICADRHSIGRESVSMWSHRTWWPTPNDSDRRTLALSISMCESKCRTVLRYQCKIPRPYSRPADGRSMWHCTVRRRCRWPWAMAPPQTSSLCDPGTPRAFCLSSTCPCQSLRSKQTSTISLEAWTWSAPQLKIPAKLNELLTGSAAQRMRYLKSLQAIATLGFFAHHIHDRVDQFGALCVMALRPVVAGARLAKHKIIGPIDLTEWAGAHRIHCARFQI